MRAGHGSPAFQPQGDLEMKKPNAAVLGAVLAASALLATEANAVLVSDPMDLGTPLLSLDLSAFDAEFVGGATTPVSPDVSLQAIGFPNSDLFLGSTVWVLGENGDWGFGRSFAASDAPIGAVAIYFNGKTVDAVGAVFNYFRTTDPGVLTLSAYTPDAIPLESHSVTIDTPGGFNEGAFYGIKRDQADIGWLIAYAPYVAVSDVQFTTPVPEPSTYALFGLGLALVGVSLARHGRR
jgi:hypothetical protein